MQNQTSKGIFGDITIVLPTLNEGENIGILISYIEKNYPGISILVVDDGSTDETKEVVKKAAARNDKITFIDRASLHLQRGLTASIIYGINAARTKYVIVMDADMQHPPAAIRSIAEKLQHCKVVVATRASVKNWALYRKIISRGMIYIGYFILLLKGAARCSDIFSGYFGLERKLFLDVYRRNEMRFVPYGYKALYDFLKCVKHSEVTVCEVPYDFMIRKKGSSKAGLKQGMALLKSFIS